MISGLLLLFLAWQFYVGYARGLFWEGVSFLGSLFSFYLAHLVYRSLAKELYLWVPYANPQPHSHQAFYQAIDRFLLEDVFYLGLAFLTAYFVFAMLIRFISIALHLLPPRVMLFFEKRSYYLFAGALAVFRTILLLAMVLSLLATIPFSSVQDALQESSLAKLWIDHLPFLSNYIKSLWTAGLAT